MRVQHCQPKEMSPRLLDSMIDQTCFTKVMHHKKGERSYDVNYSKLSYKTKFIALTRHAYCDTSINYILVFFLTIHSLPWISGLQNYFCSLSLQNQFCITFFHKPDKVGILFPKYPWSYLGHDTYDLFPLAIFSPFIFHYVLILTWNS